MFRVGIEGKRWIRHNVVERVIYQKGYGNTTQTRKRQRLKLQTDEQTNSKQRTVGGEEIYTMIYRESSLERNTATDMHIDNRKEVDTKIEGLAPREKKRRVHKNRTKGNPRGGVRGRWSGGPLRRSPSACSSTCRLVLVHRQLVPV